MNIKNVNGKDLDIYPGCSGYKYYRPPNGWKEQYKQKLQAYADHFPALEINSTFYKLPRPSTARKWKRRAEEVDEDFQFIVKANQRITHATSSPTYRRADLDIDEENKEDYGYFQPTDKVREAWKETKEICDNLSASLCLFQTPKSFTPSEENLNNLEVFFSNINADFMLAFEPWGEEWTESTLKRLSFNTDFIKVLDPLKEEQNDSEEIAYYRLHGLGDQKYKYKFSNEDLKNLFKQCKSFNGDVIYVLFNNYEMHNDCQRFLEYLKKCSIPKVPWNARAVVETIDIEYPATKDEILSKCGRWWAWIKPDKRIRVKEPLEDVEQKEFNDKQELYENIKS